MLISSQLLLDKVLVKKKVTPTQQKMLDMKKTYLKNIPVVGGKAKFTDTRVRKDVYKPYAEYTKMMDATHRNTQLRDGSYC